jgi:flagellar biosynthetic protein FliQ
MDSGDLQLAVDLGRQALLVAIKLSLPLLLAGLVVGVIISVLQAATQIQEQTLSLIPKMFAVVATIIILMPWLLTVLAEYTQELVADMGRWFR